MPSILTVTHSVSFSATRGLRIPEACASTRLAHCSISIAAPIASSRWTPALASSTTSGTVPGLNPGGANFGPDGRLYVGLRTDRSIAAFPATLAAAPERILPADIVPFPRGFAFAPDGRLFLSSGIGPTGEGARTIAAFSAEHTPLTLRLVDDPDLGPLDLLLAPSGDLVVASEHPFGATEAVTTVRQYDASTGRLVRVFRPDDSVQFRRPRGLRFGPGGNLFCVAQDEVVGFDFATGACLGALVRYPNLNGMALECF